MRTRRNCETGRDQEHLGNIPCVGSVMTHGLQLFMVMDLGLEGPLDGGQLVVKADALLLRERRYGKNKRAMDV